MWAKVAHTAVFSHDESADSAVGGVAWSISTVSECDPVAVCLGKLSKNTDFERPLDQWGETIGQIFIYAQVWHVQ